MEGKLRLIEEEEVPIPTDTEENFSEQNEKPEEIRPNSTERGEDDATPNREDSRPTSADQRPPRTFLQLIKLSSQQFAVDFAFSCETALGSPLLLLLGLPFELYGIVWTVGPILGSLISTPIGSASDNFISSWGKRRPFLFVFNILILVGCALYLTVKHIENNGLALAFTLIGIVLVDLSAFLTGTVSRAYLLDVCNLEDVERGNLIRAVIGGLGCGFGYLACAIDWMNTALGDIFGSDYDVLLVINILVCLICIVLTITSIPEEPTTTKSPSKSITDEESHTLKQGEETLLHTSVTINMREEPSRLVHGLKSILNMPSALLYLCISHFFGWMAFTIISLFFTNFFAQAVSHVFSIPASKFMSMKTMYVSWPAIFAVCMGSMAILTKFYVAVLILCGSTSFIFVAITTIPYDILAIYHTDKEFTHPLGGLRRGQGTDVGILNTTTFSAQVLVSVLMGPLVSITGTQSTVVISAAACALAASLCAAFVVKYKL
ncbi:membrane-associated transporter protein-like [Diadema antillarum]|uniref:membrane-associated transporter protein-like n=1 Tax=Diadema antillarum TaxID=105358 RepID=UPI003A8ABBA5